MIDRLFMQLDRAIASFEFLMAHVHFEVLPNVIAYPAARAKQLEKLKLVPAKKVPEAAEKEAHAAAKKSAAPRRSRKDAGTFDLEPEWKVVDTFTQRKWSHPLYFPGRCADIVLHRLAQQDEVVVGILHPDVISRLDIRTYICSALNLEYFLEKRRTPNRSPVVESLPRRSALHQ